MAQLKIGVYGTMRGKVFIDILAVMGERACLWAVCEQYDKQVEKIKENLPENVKIYDDYDAFLDSGLDAVILCNYFHEHAQCAIKAMNKGIHVLSETTAAVTMAECVELCRTVERTNAKYMLGANGPFKKCIQHIKNMREAGKLGKIFYAEAEYLHCAREETPWDENSKHWRRKLPGTYYNMHTLGTLMYATNTMPHKVTARVIRNEAKSERINRLTDHDSAISLCEMDNGAVFNVTGFCDYGPISKWFRIMAEKGVVESERYDERQVWFAPSKAVFMPGWYEIGITKHTPEYDELNMVSQEEYSQFTEEQMKIGHGGIDFWLLLYFIKYINGEHEPFFNVYRATALSAAAILGWRSVLNESREFQIPDFANEEERSAYENDYLSPFADEDSPNFISYKSR